jgi:hypothetical protein
MKGKSWDRMSVLMGAVISIAVIATMAVYLLSAGFDAGSLSMTTIIFIIVGLAAFVISGRMKSIKRGLPAHDELSKRTMQKAGYYTFLCMIYLALATQFVPEFLGWPELLGMHVSEIIIIGSALSFFGFYLWFSRKGDI